MNPNMEITNYRNKYMRMESTIENQHDEMCRKIIRLKSEVAHLVEYSKKLDSRIDVCEQLLRTPERCLETGSYGQLKIDSRKFKGEKSKVDAQRSEIQREIERLDFKADNLLDRSRELSDITERGQRALDGEDVSIWTDIERFESKQRERPSRKED